MAWYDGLLTGLDASTPQGMQMTGLLGGLSALGAGLSAAGAPRPVGQPGPSMADAFGAFGQGQRAGLMNAMQTRQLSQQMRQEAAWRDAATGNPTTTEGRALYESVPQARRAAIFQMGPQMGMETIKGLVTQRPVAVSPGQTLVGVDGPGARVPYTPEDFAYRQAGSARMSVNMPPAEGEFEKAYGKGLADQALTVLQQADKATSTQATLARMQELLPTIRAGRLGPAAGTITGFAQAVGMSPETLKRLGLPDSATPNEMFDMLASRLTASNIGGEGGVPAANFSNADMQFVQRMEANLSRRPETIGMAIAARQKIAERTIEAAQSWNEARATGKSFDKWQQEWRRYVNANPLFGGPQWREAPAGMATPMRGGMQAEPPPNPAAPVRVMTPQQYQALPSGTPFIAPDGTTRVKP